MRQLVIFLITFLLIGCSNKIENLDGFKLLPSVQELEYNNDFSNLNFENIKFAYSTNNTELPIRFEFTNHIENNKQSESTIDYSIDSSLNLNQEGYKLNVLKNKISIITGGAGLLGTQHALALTSLKSKVILIDSDYKKLIKKLFFPFSIDRGFNTSPRMKVSNDINFFRFCSPNKVI